VWAVPHCWRERHRKKRLLRFVNHADRMRIKGVGGEHAELLEAAGGSSAPGLARRSPEHLHATLEGTNEESSLVRNLASASQVSGWVDRAKSIEKRVAH